MEVIYTRDYKGKEAESIDTVADGFAQNFLIPRGIAIVATEANIEALKVKKDNETKEYRAAMIERTTNKKILEEKTISIVRKGSTSSGQMIGAVTHANIAEAIENVVGIPANKKKLHAETIKKFGLYNIDYDLGEGIVAVVKLHVAQEGVS